MGGEVAIAQIVTPVDPSLQKVHYGGPFIVRTVCSEMLHSCEFDNFV